MNYGELLDELRRRGNEVQNIDLGLDRIATVMRALGDPQQDYPSLHIAGTNGKGSVAAMTESILRHAGRRTGLYTSPHLVRLEERIRIAGEPVSAQAFGEVASDVRRHEARLLRSGSLGRPLTYFEFVTACAFLQFARDKIDVAVLEVGLGGLHDATNIVQPSTCAITGISYDHQWLLGETLAEIAAEKAGIIKPGVPVAIGRQPVEARSVLRRKAREVGAPLLDADRDCWLEIRGIRRGRCTFDLATPKGLYPGLRLSLAGRHQSRNAALAVAALECMGSPADLRSVRAGLARTRWPGRLDEYPARRRTLLDGAHNVEGARLLRDYLIEEGETRIHLVFGAVRDKDIAAMGRAIFPLAETIHLTRMSNTRTAEPADIAALHPRSRKRIRTHANSREALEAAWGECPRGGLVVVTGSLYLVGELLPHVGPGFSPDVF